MDSEVFVFFYTRKIVESGHLLKVPHSSIVGIKYSVEEDLATILKNRSSACLLVLMNKAEGLLF